MEIFSQNLDDWTFAHVYNPSVTQFYGRFTDVMFFVSVILYPCVIYVILTQTTKKMGSYKWQLIYYFTFSYGFDFVLGIWKPVYLYPTYLSFSTGKVIVT